MQSGQLVERGLPQLLADAHQSGLTGQLVLLADAAQHMIYFRHGEPVQISGRDLPPLLGELMVEMGLLSAANHRFSLATKAAGQRYGALLLRYGLATPELMQRALTEQIRRRLQALLRLGQATYQILPLEHDEGLIQGLPMRVSPQRMIYQGLLGLDGARLRLLLQPVWSVEIELASAQRSGAPFIDGPVAGAYGFGPTEQRVLDLCAGGISTGAEICERLPGERTLAVLYALHVTGALRPVARSSAVAAAPRTPVPVTAEEVRGHWAVSSSQTFLPAFDVPADSPAPVHVVAPVVAFTEAPAAPRRPGAGGRDLQMLRVDIEQLSAYAEDESYLVLLGVDALASSHAVQRALAAALRQYDAQALAEAGLAAMVEPARRLCQRLQQAGKVLADPISRELYLQEQAQAAAQPGGAAREVALRHRRARRHHARGLLHLKRHAFAAAALEFEAAARWQEDQAELVGLKVWARYCAGHMEPSPALREMQQAIQAAPRCAPLYFYAAEILRQAGAEDKAERAYRRACQLQPGYKDAHAALQALEARRLAREQVATHAAPRSGDAAGEGGVGAAAASQAGPSAATVSLLEVLRQPIGAGLYDMMRRPLGSVLPDAPDEPAALPLQPVSLLEVLRQPVGAGLYDMMRRPLSGIVAASPTPDEAPRTDPVTLMEVLTQPIGSGVLGLMRRPLAGLGRRRPSSPEGPAAPETLPQPEPASPQPEPASPQPEPASPQPVVAAPVVTSPDSMADLASFIDPDRQRAFWR